MTSAKVTRGRSQRSRLTTAIGLRPARDRESHRGVDMKGALVFEGGRPAKGKEEMRDSRRPRLAPLSPLRLRVPPAEPAILAVTHPWLLGFLERCFACENCEALRRSLPFLPPSRSLRFRRQDLHGISTRGGSAGGEGEQPPPADAKIESQFSGKFVYLLSPKMNPVQALPECPAGGPGEHVPRCVRWARRDRGRGSGDPWRSRQGSSNGVIVTLVFLLQFFLSSFSSSAFRRQGTDAGFRGRLGPRSPSPSGTAPASCACPWRPGS